MDLVTLDFESFWSDTYSLSKMTTEAYVRDDRFETILAGIKINAEAPYWVPRDSVGAALHDLHLERRAVLAHHAHFDGLILSHHYSIRPKVWFDTLGMGRALHGAHAGLSLAKLVERYRLGAKGDEVLSAKNLRFADFSPQQLHRYGNYCCNDAKLCYQLFERMAPHFTRHELALHDRVIRMFTEPVLLLDQAMLQQYAARLHAEKLALMLEAGMQRMDLMSNDMFALALIELGVEPPMKISPSWLKQNLPGLPKYIYAFAKTDAGIQALQEHPDTRVQVLVEARLKNKTTSAEKGADRLLGMAARGPATIYLKVSGASGTHRLSGGDNFNWQATERGGAIRDAVMAPPGHQIVVGDSANIEARLLDWLAGEEDMLKVYRRYDQGLGPDVYCVIAEHIYGRPITAKDNPAERVIGKKSKLGLGYGMGWERFLATVRGEAKGADGRPLVLTIAFARHVVDVYRQLHLQVGKLWKRGDDALAYISRGEQGNALDYRGVVRTCADGLLLPGGLKILYPELRREKDPKTGRLEWVFWNGRKAERIYGAKVIENVVQCLARVVVLDQCLVTAEQARNEARWVHSVHDEGVFVTPDFYAAWLTELLLANMRVPPPWAPDLPLNSEGGFHARYGRAKA